jgi:type IV secretory pathway VirB2 component (pilin)
MLLALALPAVALAAGETLFEGLATGILAMFTSNILVALCTIALIVFGILALTGNIQWKTFGGIAIGASIIFGAPAIVTYFQTLAAA